MKTKALRVFLAFLFVCVLLSSLSVLPCAAAKSNTKKSVVLSNCDVPWNGTLLNTADAKEGSACVEVTVPVVEPARAVFAISTVFSPVDASGCNTLEFDLYLSDVQAFYTNGQHQFEVCSGGAADTEEDAWSLSEEDLQNGWNHLVLPVSATVKACDLSRINFLRFYGLGFALESPLTVRLDNVRMTVREDTVPTPDKNAKIGKADPDNALPALTAADESAPAVTRKGAAQAAQETASERFSLPWYSILLLALGVAMGIALLVLCLTHSAVVLRWAAGILAVLLLLGGILIPLLSGAENGEEPPEASSLISSGVAPVTNKYPVGLIKTDWQTDSYLVADVNVKNFGAVGDGVTNDTGAFRAAITALALVGGGTVYVPAGYYRLESSLNLSRGVSLVGEPAEDPADGAVLCIYGGKGSDSVAQSAISLGLQSSVQNLAFWYPEQTVTEDSAIPYPPTLVQNASDGVTIRNVTFFNSYVGIDFAKLDNNSLQYVRDVKGTCLSVGYRNNCSYDIGKVEHFDLSAEHWLSSGLPGTPSGKALRTYLLRHATGMIARRIDWTYYSDITVTGYRVGFLASPSETGTANGHLYNGKFLDCYYGFYSERISWMLLTGCTFRAAGNDGATAVYLEKDSSGSLVMTDCTLESAGANALLCLSDVALSLSGCTLGSKTGTAYVYAGTKDCALLNVTSSDGSTDKQNIREEGVPTAKIAEYDKAVVTKPGSDRFVRLTDAPYSVKRKTDITKALKEAIDSLKSTGGTVYLPAGSYEISGHIDLWAGIELRGAACAPQNTNLTALHTNFGKNDPDGTPLFTLYDGAGLRGLSIIYDFQENSEDLHAASYTVQGHGKGIYLVNVCLPTSYNGVDLFTHRCDGHYIEFLWGALLNTGIKVGAGSENGIIRDCHVTPNSWCLRPNGMEDWNRVYQQIMKQYRMMVIGESKNEILYHNFVYGAAEGLAIENGAQNVFVLGYGVDSGDHSLVLRGNCTATLVDSQLVNLNGSDMHYLVTDPDFCGSVTMLGTAFWGTSENGWKLQGGGSLDLRSVLMLSSGTPMCRMSGGTLRLYNLLDSGRNKDFIVSAGAKELHLTANRFLGGLKIDKAAGARYTGKDF